MWTYDLWEGPVCDQKKSGRCWIYASMNPIRQKVCEKYQVLDNQFFLSTNYISFFDFYEKCKDFLGHVIELRGKPEKKQELFAAFREPVQTVGQWSYFAELASKYGLVPLSAMPDTGASKDNAWVNLLNTKLRYGGKRVYECELEETSGIKQDILREVYSFLEKKLGKPPKTFLWEYQDVSGREHAIERLTPIGFLKEICSVDFHDYIMLMHHPSQKWLAPCAYHEEKELEKRSPFLTMLSVDMDVIEDAMLRHIQAGEQVVIAADVRYQSDRTQGRLDTEIEREQTPVFDKADAIFYKQIKACHVMSVDGAGYDDSADDGCAGSWIYKVQDSHGMETGGNGHYTMTSDWFRKYVLSAVVRKEYLSGELQSLLEQEAVYMPKTERF